MTVSTIANLRSDTIFSEPKWSRSKGSRRHAHRALAANRRYARRFVFLDDRQRVAQLLKPLAPPQERGLNQVGPIRRCPTPAAGVAAVAGRRDRDVRSLATEFPSISLGAATRLARRCSKRSCLSTMADASASRH